MSNWLTAGTAKLRVIQSGIAALIDRAQEITGLWTFNRGTAAPFAVDNTSAAVVTNLNADKLDGSHASSFSAAFSTSAALRALLSDETGSGAAVFGTSPTFTTQITTPIVNGVSNALTVVATSSGANAASSVLRATNGTDTAELLLTASTGAGSTADLTADLTTIYGDIKMDTSSNWIQTNLLQTTSGALTVTPAAGGGFNVNLSGAGDFAVNTDDFVVDTSSGHVQVGTTTDSAQLTVKAGSASTIGLVVDTAASPTGDVLRLDKNGTSMIRFDLDGAPRIQLSAYDNGAGIGAGVAIFNNSNATTPAAGNLQLYTKSGVRYHLWVDDTGDLRIGTSSPTGANDTTGTVVGTQS